MLAVLDAAHDLREIRDTSPLVQFGLYRLLIAFVTDAFGLCDRNQVVELLGQGRFDPGELKAYVDALGPVFDLFDEQRPWLQVPASEGQRTKPVAELLQHLPSGSFATHFHHAHEADFALSPAVCARALAAIPAFTTAGGAGLSPSINGIPPWYVLPHGENLFETLLLNAPVGVPDSMKFEADAPAWADATVVEPKQQVTRFGRLQGLTWRPRSIRLVPSQGGVCSVTGVESPVLVREMVFTFGLKAAAEPGVWRDPNVAYRFEPGKQTPLRPRPGRMLWRDYGVLVLDQQNPERAAKDKPVWVRPIVMNQCDHLVEDGVLPRDRQFTLEAYGLRTDGKMKLFEWQVERLPVDAALFKSPLAPELVRWATARADEVGKTLARSLKAAYPREGGGNSRAFDTLIVEATQQLDARLQRSFIEIVVHPLAHELDLDEMTLRERWFKAAWGEGEDVLDRAMQGLADDADGLRRQVTGLDNYMRRRGYLARQHLPEVIAAEDGAD